MSPEETFGRRLHRMLEARPQRYHISVSPDAWGLVVTRRVIAGVEVWYSAGTGVLTLGLKTPTTQRLIPEDAVPDGAVQETSAKGWRMFRWPAPMLRMDVPPDEQPDAGRLVEQIENAFGWFSSTRRDNNAASKQ